MRTLRILLIPALFSVMALSVVYYFGPYDWADAEPDDVLAPEEVASKSPERPEASAIQLEDVIDNDPPSTRFVVQVSPEDNPGDQAIAVAEIERYIEGKSESGRRIRWVDPANGDESLVEFLGFHPELYRSGNTWLRCADFRDQGGTILDLDVVVMLRENGEHATALLYHRMTAPDRNPD